MAETSTPTGNDEKYQVTIKEINIADPGIAFTLKLLDSQSQQPVTIQGGMTVALDIYQGNEQTPHRSTLSIANDIKDDFLTFVLPFGDPDYHVGDDFSYVLKVSFPGDSGAGDIVFPRQTGLKGLGGRFDHIDVPYKLASNTRLEPGQYFRSANNAYFALMDYDGKFKIYEGLNPNSKGNLIFSHPASYDVSQGLNYVVMQTDGNFCMYAYTGALRGASYVNSGSEGAYQDSDCRGGDLIIQGDSAGLAIVNGSKTIPIEFR